MTEPPSVTGLEAAALVYVNISLEPMPVPVTVKLSPPMVNCPLTAPGCAWRKTQDELQRSVDVECDRAGGRRQPGERELLTGNGNGRDLAVASAGIGDGYSHARSLPDRGVGNPQRAVG